MGIKGLTKFIRDNCPHAIKEQASRKSYTGMKVAIDASMALYQFMVAVRSAEGGAGGAAVQMTNEAGEVTSHIVGMLSRTVRLLENGVKPVWVFDGKPPDLKSGELQKRSEAKAKAQAELKRATAEGDVETMNKMSRRMVKVTKQHNEETKQLLRLMGMPVVEAPMEAEAQCAALAKQGFVFAAASEDMDTLCFGTPKFLRQFTAAESRKLPVLEFDLQAILDGLELSMDQFVDMCILFGCDYTDRIRGIGPAKAFDLIKKHGCIEKIIENIDTEKHPVPSRFPFEEARRLFHKHEVLSSEDVNLRWGKPDEEGLKKFLIEDKQFAEERVASYIQRIHKSKSKTSQRRMDSFFKVLPMSDSAIAAKKRKATAAKEKAKKLKKLKSKKR